MEADSGASVYSVWYVVEGRALFERCQKMKKLIRGRGQYRAGKRMPAT